MIRVNLGGRFYDAYVPSGRARALILAVDGAAPKTEGNMALLTGFNDMAQASADVGILYPYANRKPIFQFGNWTVPFPVAHSWNFPGCLGPHDPGLDHDVDYLHRVASDAKVRFGAERLFAAGFSEGGVLVQHSAALHPTTFEKIASVHGTFTLPLPVIKPTTLPEVLVIHSDRDRVLRWQGGPSIFTLLMPGVKHSRPQQQARTWAALHGAQAGEPTVTKIFRRTEYRKEGRCVVTEYVIRRGAHAWDGSTMGSIILGMPMPKHMFDTSKVVWDFFLRT